MVSPLAQMLSQAVTGQRMQMQGPKGPVSGAAVAPPSRGPMPGVKKAPMPGKNAPKGPAPKHADKENRREQRGETAATERMEGRR